MLTVENLYYELRAEIEQLRIEVERQRRTNEELRTVLKSIERTANQAAAMHALDPKP